VVHGGLVYVAGQLPIVPGEPERRLEGFEAQARQVIDNVIAILEAAGSGAQAVLKSTVYIADVAHWPAFNAIYAERFGAHRPARTVVPVAGLHYGYLVEMDAVAALADPR
jgi:reactive intermediate/imine deaminase